MGTLYFLLNFAVKKKTTKQQNNLDCFSQIHLNQNGV